MHVPVVAEGVETIEELNRMRAAGAMHGQGWYWNRDLPIARFIDEALDEGLDGAPDIAESAADATPQFHPGGV